MCLCHSGLSSPHLSMRYNCSTPSTLTTPYVHRLGWIVDLLQYIVSSVKCFAFVFAQVRKYAVEQLQQLDDEQVYMCVTSLCDVSLRSCLSRSIHNCPLPKVCVACVFQIRLYMLQLVQCLKFEPYHDGPLARFLIARYVAWHTTIVDVLIRGLLVFSMPISW